MQWIILCCHILGFISSIHAIMSTRTAQGAIAWGVSLNTFPYIAVPAYWVFGRSRFAGYVSLRRKIDELTEKIPQDVAAEIEPYLVQSVEKSESGQAAERLADLPFLSGNRVDLLIDGKATFDSILKGIDEAQDYILFQFFIVKDDHLGREIQSRLMHKAQQGVRVHFLYDEVGSHQLPRQYIAALRTAGVQICEFHTRKGPRNRLQINFRNHRKVVVVDGHTAWIGGHNVGDEYLGKDPKFGHWRDTHVRIAGPAALGAQLSFMEDWNWATGDLLTLNWLPRSADDADTSVLILPTGPADPLETAGLLYIAAINAAHHRIWIASPYFVPDDAVVKALQLAGLRGVDVRILIPDKPDHLLVYLAAFSYFGVAGQTGVQFYRYTDGFLHQKVILVDDRAAAVGTANFDNRSFRLNFEITALIHDHDFAARIESMFEDDFAHARRVQAGEYDDKPFWFKLGVRLARLTAPIQ